MDRSIKQIDTNGRARTGLAALATSTPGGEPKTARQQGAFTPIGFLELLFQRVSLERLDALNERGHPAWRPAHVLSRGQLLAGLFFHYTVGLAGSFGDHLFLLLEIKMAESALSQRRQATPFSVFDEF